MLEAEVLTQIRATVAAELGPRDAMVRQALQALLNKLAARGHIRGGAELHERARLASDELDVRAGIIWAVIQRCQNAFGRPDVPDLLGGLLQQVAEHISHHANTLGAIVDPQAAPGWPRDVGTFVPDAIKTKRDQLITKYQNEARFYLRAVTQPGALAGGGVTVHGNVGSIQTGAYAVANIHIDTAATPRLVEALAALTAAIQGAQDISADARAHSLEIAQGLQTAAKAAKPNGPMLKGLLSGLSTTVQTVASLKPAWDQVKDAAAALGIPLPF